MHCCDNHKPTVCVDLLQRERLLLPLTHSLMACPPWQEAEVLTLPPATTLLRSSLAAAG